MGLALACRVKGYKLIRVTTDKQSKEKIDVLKAVELRLYICPTDVDPEDPKSYYSTAKRISKKKPQMHGMQINIITPQIHLLIMKKLDQKYGNKQMVK